jgi:bifunctional UDP-N-acetylglucosamine pyrophosphorylase/glucosamine-1-phosphate N-acetyltransferase
MAGGVTMTAPETVFLAADTELEPGVEIGPYVVFGPRVAVAAGARILPFCHLEGVRIAAGAEIGPFTRIRPGAEIGERAKVGNFVEVKNATLEAGAKANHLSYIGDARVGSKSNIGAGTITCNYDGTAKHRTEIGKGVFIGSNAALVAPVTIGDGAFVGAGSTINRDVPAGSLSIARGRQTDIPDGAARIRARRRPGP